MFQINARIRSPKLGKRGIVLGTFLASLVLLSGCARLNGYRNHYQIVDSRVEIAPAETISEPYWKVEAGQDAPNPSLELFLVRDRMRERTKIVRVNRLRQKVYLNNNRGFEAFTFTLFLHDFGVLPMMDLVGRLANADTGFAGPLYEKERPNYFIRLGHWVGWWTFSYPVYEIGSRITRKEVQSDREIATERRRMPPLRENEPLPDRRFAVSATNGAGSVLYRDDRAETDAGGRYRLDLASILSQAKEGDVFEISARADSPDAGQALFSEKYRRTAGPAGFAVLQEKR